MLTPFILGNLIASSLSVAGFAPALQALLGLRYPERAMATPDAALSDTHHNAAPAPESAGAGRAVHRDGGSAVAWDRASLLAEEGGAVPVEGRGATWRQLTAKAISAPSSISGRHLAVPSTAKLHATA